MKVLKKTKNWLLLNNITYHITHTHTLSTLIDMCTLQFINIITHVSSAKRYK